MIQQKMKNRTSTRFIQIMLDSLQHMLILLAFVMFFSWIQVATAQAVTDIQEHAGQFEPVTSYLNLLVGLFSLVLAGLVKHISQQFRSKFRHQNKDLVL